MKKKDLKRLIKPMIRECLAEIFMEMNLETIVEGVVRRQIKTRPHAPLMTESVIPEAAPAPKPPASSQDQKKLMRERLGISEEEWKTMYSDTAESDNPVLTGDDNGNSELVSENALRQSGLYKDYSKFV
jgi:hypothetical protein